MGLRLQNASLDTFLSRNLVRYRRGSVGVVPMLQEQNGLREGKSVTQ